MTSLHDFALSFARVNGHVEVKVAGDVDAWTAGQLSDALFDIIEGQGNLSVTVDLADLTFIDSNGLSVLMLALSWTEARGGTLTVTGVRPHTAKLLQIVGMRT